MSRSFPCIFRKPCTTARSCALQLVHTHALLAEVEREWEVGMRLNQLAEADGSLPGFMGVGAGTQFLESAVICLDNNISSQTPQDTMTVKVHHAQSPGKGAVAVT